MERLDESLQEFLDSKGIISEMEDPLQIDGRAELNQISEDSERDCQEISALFEVHMYLFRVLADPNPHGFA